VIRPCADKTCPNPATYRGRCQRHARERQNVINLDRAAQRKIYNSKRWQLTRRKHLFDNPLCDCGAIATDVHHKTDLADGGEPFASSNLQALCAGCHSKITGGRVWAGATR